MDSHPSTDSARDGRPTDEAGVVAGPEPRAAFAVLPGRKRFRQRVWLLGDVQMQFVLAQGFALIVCMIVMAGFVFWPLVAGLESDDPQRRAEYVEQMLTLHRIFWPTAGLAFVILLVFTVYFSHRIAGPLYRLRASMQSVARGDLIAPIRLRPRDILLEDADVFNEMLAGLRERIAAADAAQRALGVTVTRMSAASHDMNAEGRERVAQLRREHRALADTLEQFSGIHDAEPHAAHG